MNGSRQTGFTLLELLVVIAVIGIIGSRLLLSMDNGNEEHELKALSQKVQGLLQQASHEAILRGHDIGLLVEDKNIRFLLPGKKGWTEPQQQDRLTNLKIKSRWSFELYDENMRRSSKLYSRNRVLPNLLLTTDGGSTAFTLLIGNAENRLYFKVSSTGNGVFKSTGHESS